MNPTQQKGLNKIETQILELIYEGQLKNQKKKQVQISKSLKKDKGQISKKLKELEDEEIIRRSKEGRSKRLSITNKGCAYLLKSKSDTSEEDNNLLNLHNFGVKFQIQNIEEIEEQRDENWREKFIQKIEQESRYNPCNDSHIVYDQVYTYLINRRNVIVYIENLAKDDPYSLKKEAIDKTIEGAKRIEKETPLELTERYSGIRAEVSNEHLAIIGDPLSKLVHETDYEGCDIKIIDEEGRTRLWADDSHSRKDLEAGTQYGVHGFAEDDMDSILKLYRLLLRNSKNWPVV